MENESVILEECWDIFVLTGMPWEAIKVLSTTDRKFIAGKAGEAKERAAKQKADRDAYLAARGPQPE